MYAFEVLAAHLPCVRYIAKQSPLWLRIFLKITASEQYNKLTFWAGIANIYYIFQLDINNAEKQNWIKLLLIYKWLSIHTSYQAQKSNREHGRYLDFIAKWSTSQSSLSDHQSGLLRPPFCRPFWTSESSVIFSVHCQKSHKRWRIQRLRFYICITR